MGFLDKIFGNKKSAPVSQKSTEVAKGLDVQSDEIRAESRRKMEAEMEASRANRDAAPTKES